MQNNPYQSCYTSMADKQSTKEAEKAIENVLAMAFDYGSCMTIVQPKDWIKSVKPFEAQYT